MIGAGNYLDVYGGRPSGRWPHRYNGSMFLKGLIGDQIGERLMEPSRRVRDRQPEIG